MRLQPHRLRIWPITLALALRALASILAVVRTGHGAGSAGNPILPASLRATKPTPSTRVAPHSSSRNPLTKPRRTTPPTRRRSMISRPRLTKNRWR